MAAAQLAVVVALGLGSTSCGKVARQGEGGSYLIVTIMEAASGAEPGEFGGTLHSDVVTIVDDVPSIFSDLGRVTLTLGLKDPGPPQAPLSPSRLHDITVNRYRVVFIRADGRNTPGVDVPYPFEGAFTATVRGDTTVAFTLVRHIAKQEPPLIALANSAVLISTIAEITFYGHDQTGHASNATARIGVDFGNFGDPD